MPRALLFALILLAGCTSEATTPVDLNPTTSVTVVDPTDPGEDPNAEVRQQAQEFADQQCLDDPELEVGLIEIVDPETQEVAGRIEADCAEVRARD